MGTFFLIIGSMSYNMCWMLPLVIFAFLIPQFESFDMKDAQYLVKDHKNQFYVAGRGHEGKAKKNPRKENVKNVDVEDQDIEEFIIDMFENKAGDYADDGTTPKEETFIIKNDQPPIIEG